MKCAFRWTVEMTQECGSVSSSQKAKFGVDRAFLRVTKSRALKFSCGEPGEAPHCDEPATNAASGPPPPRAFIVDRTSHIAASTSARPFDRTGPEGAFGSEKSINF